MAVIRLDESEWHPKDCTGAIQNAIDRAAESRARLAIPFVGEPWRVGPLHLRTDSRLWLHPGVVLEARAKLFSDPRACLLSGENIFDVSIEGHGAALDGAGNMQRDDSEFRHCLSLRGCKGVVVAGLTTARSGGDGIYLSASRGGSSSNARKPCSDLHFSDCSSVSNYRQGLSVVSATDAKFDRCRFVGTRGTAPQAGICVEPASKHDSIYNIHFNHCESLGNDGSGLVVNLDRIVHDDRLVTIAATRSRFGSVRQSAVRAICSRDGEAVGRVLLEDCHVTDTQRNFGVDLRWPDVGGLRFELSNISWHDCQKILHAAIWKSSAGVGGNRSIGCIQISGGRIFGKTSTAPIRLEKDFSGVAQSPAASIINYGQPFKVPGLTDFPFLRIEERSLGTK